MAVRRVQCPYCSQTMNIAASMGSIQCNACGKVFPASESGNSNPQTNSQDSQNPYHPDRTADGHSADGLGDVVLTKTQKILVGGSLAVFLVLMFAFVTFLMSTKSTTESSNTASADGIDTRSQPDDNTPALMSDSEENLPYRIVDISEAERLRLYRDYRRMENSGFGKARRIPKGGKAGQDLNKMLVGIADREIEMMAIQNKLTNDDVRQIIAEGKIKGWE